MPSADAEPVPLHHYPNGRVARAAGPDQVGRFGVLLVAVHVVDFDVFSRAAERADPGPGRSALTLIRAVARGPVGDRVRRLPPALAAPAGRYSFPE